MIKTLSIDDIEPFLPPEDVGFAQTRAVLKKLLEFVPILGHGFALHQAAAGVERGLERDVKLAATVDALYIQVKALAEQMTELDRASATQVAEALRQESRLQDNEIAVVLDSYLGLAAVLNLPRQGDVPRELISEPLIRGYADVVRATTKRELVVNRANQMRASIGDIGPDEHRRIDVGELPDSDAFNFWYRAFDTARSVDRRMVACLLLAQDPTSFPAQGRDAYDNLLNFLNHEDPTLGSSPLATYVTNRDRGPGPSEEVAWPAGPTSINSDDTVIVAAKAQATSQAKDLLARTFVEAVPQEVRDSILTEPTRDIERLLEGGISEIEHRLLQELLAFIRKRDFDDPEAQAVIDQTCILAQRYTIQYPMTVATVFYTIEKHLKRSGDKKRVLDIARRSIEAARHVGRMRTEEMVRMEAHALICGESWVYQRVGKLDDARLRAERSLDIGHGIGWTRNDAFCHKCLGRLYRMQAEAAEDKVTRESLLNMSAYYLDKAIEIFSVDLVQQFGPRSKQVGDCYSLLGRTRLVMGDVKDAEAHAEAAQPLITDYDSKEAIDLRILCGDIQDATGNKSDAIQHYNSVLAIQATDAVRTEMQARALLRRGRCRASLGQREDAKRDLDKAAEIWKRLDEQRPAAEATIESILLTVNIETPRLALLRSEKPEVAAIALSNHAKKFERVRGAIARRTQDPNDAYWEQLVKDAQYQWALVDIEW